MDQSGSRYLFQSFDAAHARIDANERVAGERLTAIDFRLGRIENGLERVEQRMWLWLYGVAAFLLMQGAEAVARALLE
ncbi:hypothetical protein LV780_05025 [Cereibacter azotoformans]|uniref:Uncharacterized protein n=2 Tax=Cereibacter TaxID=1653176 RepID=A0A2T5K9F0_9RHOB|nr:MULTISPECIES: hypothetical protein [Cereibacter]AXQ93228.1 hypothetical protein D0Z66_05015 [Cereibacter sphaeroides]MBO4169112.1 hypothetical protein [Cereibacter azotoformans]PTR19047.1 hypothetical protein C8J28_106195 [Cereibacter azotoformans]UIJ31543.1 hypothetical protein LV780_05025 [Cereibacter azotoformans]